MGDRLPKMPFTGETPEARAMEEITKRMQDGWKMLNEVCPISHFPLVERDGIKYSGRCNLEVLSVSQADDRNVAPRDSPAASDDSFEMIPDEEESGVQLASTDEQSAKMGELLLQGWRMMEECCEYGGCPYMEHPVNGRKFSVATGKYTDEEVEVVQQAPAAAASPITPIVQGQVSEEDMSAKMGELMLQGWVMLDEVCPITQAVPLMLNKASKRKFSVATNSYVDELESSAQFADVEEEPAAKPAKPAVKPIKLAKRPAQAPQPLSSDKLTEFEDQSYWGAAPPAPLEGGARRIAAEEEEEEGRTLSVSDRYEQARQALLEHTTYTSRASSSQQPVHVEPPAATPAAGVSDAEMSQELSTKLLQGWILLDEACPLTGRVDLLLSPDGRKYSVAAAQYMDAPAPQTKQAPTAVSAANTAVRAAAVQPTAQPITVQQPVQPTAQPITVQQPVQPTAQPITVQQPVQQRPEVANAVEQALAAVASKMVEAAGRLSCNSTDDLQSKQTVELIESCAKALHTMSK